MYPRTRDSYEALVAEFGDDPSIVNISRPSAEKPELPSSESENELLRDQLKHIRSTLDAILSQQSGQVADDGMSDPLAAEDTEIERLGVELQGLNLPSSA